MCFAKENDAFCSLCRAYRSGKESDTGLYLSTFLAIPFAKVSEYFSNCQKGPSNWTRGYLYSVSDAALHVFRENKIFAQVCRGGRRRVRDHKNCRRRTTSSPFAKQVLSGDASKLQPGVGFLKILLLFHTMFQPK